MKKICELKDITYSTFFYEDFMIVCNRQKDYLFLCAFNYQLVCKLNLGNIYPINVIDGRLYLFNHDLYIYDERQNKFDLYKSSVNGGNVIPYKGFFIEKRYDRKTKELNVVFYDKSGENVLWSKIFCNRSSFLNIGNHLYITDISLRHIDFIDEHTGNIQKTLDFENPQISRFVYFYDNTLILSLEIKPLEEYQLLGLDAGTGEEKWRIKQANFMYIQDPETGYLYDIGGKRFNVINPLEGKVIYQCDMTSENEKFGVIPEWGILGKDGIYFMDNFPRSKVGFINFNTHKIDFVLDLEFDAGIKIMKMVYHNGRLYILDTNETLHIFAE